MYNIKNDRQYEINKALWDNMLSRLDQIRTAEQLVDYVNFYGAYFSLNPTDYLYCQKIEDKIKEFQPATDLSNTATSGRMLHVATQIYATGGHTKVIENWIKYQENVSHDILLTAQYRPHNISSLPNTNIINLPRDASVKEKIKLLQDIYVGYDKIVLHIHPYDIVPLLAINKKQIHKFFFYNHADHIFNIGTSLTGTTYDMSAMGSQFTLNFRGAKNSKVIPVPIPKPLYAITTTTVQIPETAFVVLTVGSKYKYEPTPDFSMFKLAEDLCKSEKNIYFVFIGPDQKQKRSLNITHERVLMLGTLKYEVLLAYYKRCDVYVDSIPISGGIAILNAALYNKPIITIGNGLNIFDSVKPFEVGTEELKKNILQLKHNRQYREEQAAKANYLAAMHVDNQWVNSFSQPTTTKITLPPDKLYNYMHNLRSKFIKVRTPNNPYWLTMNDLIVFYKLTRNFRLTSIVIIKQIFFSLFYRAIINIDEIIKRIR